MHTTPGCSPVCSEPLGLDPPSGNSSCCARTRSRFHFRRRLAPCLRVAPPAAVGPLRIVEDPNLVRVKIARHPRRVTPPGYRALDDDPVVTGEQARARYPGGVTRRG